MIITDKLKERFCKDCNIPINIYDEPYFSSRIELLDAYYDSKDKWAGFVKELRKYNSEQDYFEDYNRVKDEAINCIKNSEAYKMFCEEDMNRFKLKYRDLPSRDIFKPTNDGRFFVSIDMRKANFSSLQHYGMTIEKDMFVGASYWEDFIGLFTDNPHIINSKYIRQVILGNCNPKRQVTYEKYLMDSIVDKLIKANVDEKYITSFSNDEIVLDITDIASENKVSEIIAFIGTLLDFPLKVEVFELHRILGVNGYYKEIYNSKYATTIEVKCLDGNILPFVIRKLKEEEVTEEDKAFKHNGLLSTYVETPKIIL